MIMKSSGGKKCSMKRKNLPGKKDGSILDYLEPYNDNSLASSRTKRVRRESPTAEPGNHPARKTPPNSEKSVDEEREFTVNLGDGGKEHVVKGKIHDDVLTALRSSKYVRDHMDKNKGKKMYLIGKRGIEGCINLGMPLKYVPNDSQFEMKFYRGKQPKSPDKLEYRQYDNNDMKCILFFVAPNANNFETNKPLNSNIIKCNGLLKEHSNLCICAPQKENIKDSLCKDGRFMPLLNEKDWVLMENKRSIPNSHLVEKLSNKTFTIYVKTERRSRSGKDQKNEQVPLVSQERKTVHYFNSNLLQLYPELEEQGNISNQFFEDLKKQRERKKDVFRVYKEVFGKEKKNSILIKLENLHVNLSKSVGYIEWGTTAKEGSATCFVLCGKYILTCHHVVKLIVGEGVEEKDWAHKISQSARVTFSYEDKHPKENDWFSLEEWFEISDDKLDFAVLKLNENENKSPVPDSLVQFVSPPPFSGLVDIIGHPDGEAKSVDGCSVINVFERQQECVHRLQQEQGTECHCFNCGYDAKGKTCVHMYNPRDFPEIINNPDAVTYDTSFFLGSSGSPVFDRNGRLVAMHAAGYSYGGKYKQKSIIEFGYSMKSILSVIEEKYKSWYDSEIVPVLQAGPDAGNNIIDLDPSTDVEMESVDD